MTLIDSHAHLQWKDYKEDFQAVLDNAQKSGLSHILNIGTSLETSKESVELADKYDHIFATVGLHPHDAKDIPDDFIDQLEKLANHPKVLGIGEIGLDFFYKHSPKDQQLSVFTKQVKLAKELSLPISIHCREAFDDCFSIIDQIKPDERKGVFHCFTGSIDDAKKAIERGFYISISGIVTFRKALGLQDVVKEIPLAHMLIETDCPFLAPEPFRGKRNEPAYVSYVAQKISELKNISVEEVGKQTTENATALFQFKPRSQ